MSRAPALLVAAALVVAACGGGDADEQTRATTIPTVGDAATDDTTTEDPTSEERDVPTDPVELATEAYTWGLPLVITQRTMATFGGFIGVNQVFTQAARSDATTRVVVAPNTDTLYAIAVVDLRGGPLLLDLPAIEDRYHTFQIMDAWTNSFAYLGTRTSGGRAGTWALTPPGWEGELPGDVEQIEVPTQRAFLLGRVFVEDDEDVAAVTALTRQVQLRPLDPDQPAPPPLDPPAGPPAAAGRDTTFFDELGDALAIDAPTTDHQRSLLAALSAIGIGPGLHPAGGEHDDTLRAGLEAATERLRAGAAEGEAPGGWRVHTELGTYGDDLEKRAVIARLGWGANVDEEAVYPTAAVDAEGRPLTGERTYRLRFPADELPPVDAFWSLTLYGPDRFFVDHPTRRYAVRHPGDLEFEADGSLELAIGTERPADVPEANWLPAPAGPFSLMLRLYLPDASVTAGEWRPPPLVAD